MSDDENRHHDALRTERRVNPVLRAQVEEMLASIRSAASNETWTLEERAQHQASMARIMDLVREHAMARGRAPRSTHD